MEAADLLEAEKTAMVDQPMEREKEVETKTEVALIPVETKEIENPVRTKKMAEPPTKHLPVRSAKRKLESQVTVQAANPVDPRKETHIESSVLPLLMLPPLKEQQKRGRDLKIRREKFKKIMTLLKAVTDCNNFITKFLAKPSINFETFCDVWNEMTFAFIYSGNYSCQEMQDTVQEVLWAAKICWLSPATTKRRLAAAYLLFALYFQQPTNPCCNIQLSLQEWLEVKCYLKFIQVNKLKEHLYMLHKLWKCDAFELCAVTKDLDLEEKVSRKEVLRMQMQLDVQQHKERNNIDTYLQKIIPANVIRTSAEEYKNHIALLNAKIPDDKKIQILSKGNLSDKIHGILERLKNIETKVQTESKRNLQETQGIGGRRRALKNRSLQTRKFDPSNPESSSSKDTDARDTMDLMMQKKTTNETSRIKHKTPFERHIAKTKKCFVDDSHEYVPSIAPYNRYHPIHREAIIGPKKTCVPQVADGPSCSNTPKITKLPDLSDTPDFSNTSNLPDHSNDPGSSNTNDVSDDTPNHPTSKTSIKEDPAHNSLVVEKKPKKVSHKYCKEYFKYLRMKQLGLIPHHQVREEQLPELEAQFSSIRRRFPLEGKANVQKKEASDNASIKTCADTLKTDQNYESKTVASDNASIKTCADTLKTDQNYESKTVASELNSTLKKGQASTSGNKTTVATNLSAQTKVVASKLDSAPKEVQASTSGIKKTVVASQSIQNKKVPNKLNTTSKEAQSSKGDNNYISDSASDEEDTSGEDLTNEEDTSDDELYVYDDAYDSGEVSDHSMGFYSDLGDDQPSRASPVDEVTLE